MLHLAPLSRVGPSRHLAGPTAPRCQGLTLLEVAVSFTLIAVILIGVTATISTAALGNRATERLVESRQLLSRVLEEIQASPWDTLLSFDGMFLIDGQHRADVRADLADVGLVRLEVTVTSTIDSGVRTRGVVLVADRG